MPPEDLTRECKGCAGVVDVCLIPEIEFDLDQLVKHLTGIVEKKGHCVVCVAEGAGQQLLEKQTDDRTDLSGNPILEDVGRFLRRTFKSKIKDADLKYIDPSYMIRSVQTTTGDRILCKVLGQSAVHGAFAGFTGFTVGLVNTHYVFLPIPTIIQATRSDWEEEVAAAVHPLATRPFPVF
ncbi:hypothetical protein WJX84_000389 [Apatococcus fuscideae]|uniref:Phosphofructokinase domain-containing protein n=1 Tax=Apatococcus fuscideae TaxID=2026836 RepID=A0AAW1SWR9_9CHLO